MPRQPHFPQPPTQPVYGQQQVFVLINIKLFFLSCFNQAHILIIIFVLELSQLHTNAPTGDFKNQSAPIIPPTDGRELTPVRNGAQPAVAQQHGAAPAARRAGRAPGGAGAGHAGARAAPAPPRAPAARRRALARALRRAAPRAALALPAAPDTASRRQRRQSVLLAQADGARDGQPAVPAALPPDLAAGVAARADVPAPARAAAVLAAPRHVPGEGPQCLAARAAPAAAAPALLRALGNHQHFVCITKHIAGFRTNGSTCRI